MALFMNIIIACAIFGYAVFTLIKTVKKQKAGKCAACSLQKQCPSESCESVSQPVNQGK